LRSGTNMEENWNGAGPRPPSAPGTTTNIPGYSVNTDTGNSEYNKTDGVSNYEITTRQSDEVLTPGGIRRLTASVVVDGELEEQQIAKLRETVQGAIGYNEARGDSLVVNSWPFNDDLAKALVEELRVDRMWRIVQGAVTTILVIASVVLAALWWLRRRRARIALDAMQKDVKRVPTIQEMLTSPDLLAFQGEMAVLEEQLKAYARSNPGEVANLVNEWISAET